jgi:hypothetical protein
MRLSFLNHPLYYIQLITLVIITNISYGAPQIDVNLKDTPVISKRTENIEITVLKNQIKNLEKERDSLKQELAETQKFHESQGIELKKKISEALTQLNHKYKKNTDEK